MRRAVVPIAIALALVSGVVLAETRRVVLVPAVTLDGDPEAGANEGVVRRFYAAVNEVLATGEEGPLDDVVDADLIEHPARPGVTPDRAGFVRALRALRATAPDVRLTVFDVVAQGGRSRRSGSGGRSTSFGWRRGRSSSIGATRPKPRCWNRCSPLRSPSTTCCDRW